MDLQNKKWMGIRCLSVSEIFRIPNEENYLLYVTVQPAERLSYNYYMARRSFNQ